MKSTQHFVQKSQLQTYICNYLFRIPPFYSFLLLFTFVYLTLQCPLFYFDTPFSFSFFIFFFLFQFLLSFLSPPPCVPSTLYKKQSPNKIPFSHISKSPFSIIGQREKRDFLGMNLVGFGDCRSSQPFSTSKITVSGKWRQKKTLEVKNTKNNC